MKTKHHILIPILLFSVACTTTRETASSNKKYEDDVYYSPSKNEQAITQTERSESKTSRPSTEAYEEKSGESQKRFDYSSSEEQTDKQGNTYITNNYYDTDDYYDYAYASRIRRFYMPYDNFGYYNSYYTNRYWYDYNPASWGVSIYLGYSWWWGPSVSYYYTPYHNYYWNRPFSYDLWHHHYSPWWNPYQNYSYWRGYNHGYLHGYYDGYYGSTVHNPNYYNSYDRTSHYYGHRSSASSNNRTAPSYVPRTLAERYERAMKVERTNTPRLNKATEPVTSPSEKRTIDPAYGRPERSPSSNPEKPIEKQMEKMPQEKTPTYGRPERTEPRQMEEKPKIDPGQRTPQERNNPNYGRPERTVPQQNYNQKHQERNYNPPKQKSDDNRTPVYTKPARNVPQSNPDRQPKQYKQRNYNKQQPSHNRPERSNSPSSYEQKNMSPTNRDGRNPR